MNEIYSNENDEDINIPELLPILPLRNTVIFPHQVQPLAVGRPKSLELLEDLGRSEKVLGMITQIDGNIEEPFVDELYKYGIAGKIVKSFRMPDGSEHIIVQGVKRIRIKDYVQESPYIKAEIEVLGDPEIEDVTVDALVNNSKNLFNKIVELSTSLTNEHRIQVLNTTKPGKIADVITSVINVSTEDKQEVIQTLEIKARLEKVHYLLNKELQVLEIENKIQKDVQGELNKTQREFVLKEQMKAIQRELGEVDDGSNDIDEIRTRLDKVKLPDSVAKTTNKEISRLKRMNQMAAEYNVIHNYLEWVADLPWDRKTNDRIDLKLANKILDRDHYGLERVKKRIVEFLAVQKLNNEIKGPILCLFGPPGVGKTSLGQSIAKALNRKFSRIALGGVSDESEIRGHRRTYIGSMPGRIIRELKRVAVNNPVIMLDEIDKLGRDHRGDPSAALLEVLDPEQNHAFIDHYLDVEYDLSKVMFIATANQLDTIPGPLRDRLEIIDISGYIEEEKINIAEKYLIPKQIKTHGLDNKNIKFHKSSIRHLIHHYTKEAGVRGLEKKVASVVRGIATDLVMKNKLDKTITKKLIEKILGPIIFDSEVKERTSRAGVATGMAWTPFGGEILFIEATKMPGSGQLKMTGKLGDVMKESVQTAWSLLRSKWQEFGFVEDFYKNIDIHLHVPAGATPKDGPSAGITMFTALYSIFSGFHIKNSVAMTGEITLRGLVLPIGGLKEKVIAAKRAGISTIIAPEKNKKDLQEIPKQHLKGLSFFFVKEITEVISIAIDFEDKKKKSFNVAYQKPLMFV
jgi:ATP-dependent Lon protease